LRTKYEIAGANTIMLSNGFALSRIF